VAMLMGSCMQKILDLELRDGSEDPDDTHDSSPTNDTAGYPRDADRAAEAPPKVTAAAGSLAGPRHQDHPPLPVAPKGHWPALMPTLDDLLFSPRLYSGDNRSGLGKASIRKTGRRLPRLDEASRMPRSAR
jgi:hypothetical protein